MAACWRELALMGIQKLKVKEEGAVEYPIGKDNQSIHINYNWCKGCTICIEFCPKEVYDISALGQPIPTRIEACTRCMICVQRCPDFAICITDASGKAKPHPEAELIAASEGK
jgi:2-oxoglutarate ferredoxin oxidoreductase subunit delta